MQRVDEPIGVDGLAGCAQRLSRDLTTEYALKGGLRRLSPAEQIHVDLLKVENRDELCD
jgi:hypothetical protein